MIPYSSPQLMQCVAAAPVGLWGLERFNRGYSGPTVRVRRASDSSIVDCCSLAEIIAHCTGTNGFVHTVYDQSGNAKNLTQTTLAAQPKVYDSSTGLMKFGRTPVMQFDGTDDYVVRADHCGLSTGNIAITSAVLYGTFTNTAVTAWALGADTGGAAGDCWYQTHGAATTIGITSRIPSRTWTCTSPSGTPCYFVYSKANAADMSTVVARQNKSVLTQSAVTAGNMNLGNNGGVPSTRIGNSVANGQYAACTVAVHGHWGSDLSAADKDALEQVLERLRVQ